MEKMAVTYDDFERQARQSGLYDSFNAEDLALARKNPQTGVLILNAKQDYMNAPAGAAGDNMRALAHESIQSVRRKFGNYETSADGMTVTHLPSQNAPENTGDDHYRALLWAEKKRAAAQSPNNGEPFAQYEKTINAQREAAQKDAIGKTAALTGGYGSSSAVQAANSVASEYARVLAEKELELSQEAYDRKLSEAQLAASLGDYTKLNALGISTADYEARLAEERAQNKYAALLAQAEAAAKYGDTSQLAGLGIDVTKATMAEEYERKLNEAKLAAQYGDMSQLAELGIDVTKATAVEEYERRLSEAKLAAEYGDFSKLQALGIDTSAAQAVMQNQGTQTGGSVDTPKQDYEGLFTGALSDAYSAQAFINNNYKQYGFSSSTGLYDAFEEWRDGNDGDVSQAVADGYLRSISVPLSGVVTKKEFYEKHKTIDGRTYDTYSDYIDDYAESYIQTREKTAEKFSRLIPEL